MQVSYTPFFTDVKKFYFAGPENLLFCGLRPIINIMTMRFQIAAFALIILTFALNNQALAGDKKDRDTARDLGYIVGRELADNKDDNIKYYRNGEKKRIYTTKKLYEGRDVIVYRGYDSKGRKYTITKRK